MLENLFHDHRINSHQQDSLTCIFFTPREINQ